MLLELRFSIWTLGLGSGTFIAALYGMNLKNFIEETDIGFWGISAVSAAISVIVLVYGLQRLRRVQRVSMWGHGDACLPRDRTGVPAIRDAGWQQARAQLRAEEEKRGLWGLGLGFSRRKQSLEKAKMLEERLREERMHGRGPLWTRTGKPAGNEPL
jgi:hypothetical protein